MACFPARAAMSILPSVLLLLLSVGTIPAASTEWVNPKMLSPSTFTMIRLS